MVTKLLLIQEFFENKSKGHNLETKKGKQLLCLTHCLDLIHIPKWLPGYGL